MNHHWTLDDERVIGDYLSSPYRKRNRDTTESEPMIADDLPETHDTPALQAAELAASLEPCVLLWVPSDPDADTLYWGFNCKDDALRAAHVLDRDTSGDWFIEPLRGWRESPLRGRSEHPPSPHTVPGGQPNATIIKKGTNR